MGDNLPKKFIWRHNKKNKTNPQEATTEIPKDDSLMPNSFDASIESNKMQ
jgi:hypothetical protein